MRMVLHGGNLNNTSNDGPFYLNLNNALANSNWNYAAFGLLLLIAVTIVPGSRQK